MSNDPYSGSAVKRSALHFLVGKVFSALLTFTILLSLVRVLTVSEYATYITLIAGFELSLSLSALGISWMEARYVPDFRLHASKPVLLGFIARLIQFQAGVLFSFALIAWLCLDFLLLKMEISAYREAAQFYLLILVIEGFARRLRDGTLGVLLQQKIAQISLVTRNFIFICILGVLYYLQKIDLVHVVQAELFASIIGVIISLIGLWQCLRKLETKEDPNWVKPKWSQMWKVAINMYVSLLMTTLVYGIPTLILIVRYTLGVKAEEIIAIFGFLSNLYTQVSSYLPASLLFSLVRPKLVASYVGSGGITELTRNANIVGKFSLFVLMPLLVFTGLTSEELVGLLSGGKFLHTGYYLPAFLCALIASSQRQILETVAVVTGHSYLCNYAAIGGIIILPMTFGLIEIGFGLWAPIIAITMGGWIFCGTIVKGISKKTNYHADFAGFCRMILSALVAYLVGVLTIFSGHGWFWIIAVGIWACTMFLLSAAIIKPFSNAERLIINQFIKRDIFIW